MFHHSPRGLENCFAIDEIEFGSIDAAFITSAQEGFEEAIVEWIVTFFASFHHGLWAIGESRDLLGQSLVPQFPTEPVRHMLSDISPATPVLAFNGDDINHEIQPSFPVSTTCGSQAPGKDPTGSLDR